MRGFISKRSSLLLFILCLTLIIALLLILMISLGADPANGAESSTIPGGSILLSSNALLFSSNVTLATKENLS
jgi:hypothetical protein